MGDATSGSIRLSLEPRLFVVILVLLGHLGGFTRLAAETGPMIDPQVRTAVATGRARVVVNLRIPGGARPEGALSEAEAAAQRTAIVAVQQGVVARLSGTGFSVSRRFTTVPQ